MSIRSILRVFALTLTSCTFALALATCGGSKKGPVVQGLRAPQASFSPGSSVESKTSPEGLDYPESTSLDDALAELDALERPEGVDAELWGELKDALEEALVTNSPGRRGSLAP
jgi:hypothetical protein